ncbi:SKP1-like protein 21 [Zea mays]|uniref:SKP1-like protein 21 n=1 Tax=Zea mays TaxID=4577 RepID=A0A1D6JKA2_MAIZE|nr:SKP1-like protein 21 [Zea mays]
MFCPMICREIVKNGTGSSKNHAIALPERVNPASLSLILDYCRFHQVTGRSNKERKSFDEKFVRIETERLCELTSAADSLQLKPLVDLTSRALARIIEGKTPEEIRDIFHLPDDLTEEEKLEPLKNVNDDPRIRLLNRLYAKKRKELQERQKLKVTMMDCTCCVWQHSFSDFIQSCSLYFRMYKYKRRKKMRDLWMSYFVLLMGMEVQEVGKVVPRVRKRIKEGRIMLRTPQKLTLSL